MIYRVFPYQDAFIAKDLRQNTGRDEILELGYCSRAGLSSAARILLSFQSDEIQKILQKNSGKNFQAVVRLFSAEKRNVPASYDIEVYTLQQTWNEGIGRVTDGNVWTQAVSWFSRNGKEDWEKPGGTIGKLPFRIIHRDQSMLEFFGDLEIDVSSELRKGNFESILIKLADEELVQDGTHLSFFSSNTHTIFVPYLEIRYENSTYSTDKPVLIQPCLVSPKNLPETLTKGDKIRVNLGVKPQFPKRVFSTASLYLEEYVLPETTYWGIQDTYSTNMVVNFSVGTKVEADSEGSFIRLDTSYLPSERFLGLVLKVESEQSEYVYHLGTPFRIRRYAERGIQ